MRSKNHFPPIPLCKLITSRDGIYTWPRRPSVITSVNTYDRALPTDVTVHGRKRRWVLPAPLATMSRNGQQWWRNCFQNAVYRIRRIESSVDDRQSRINTRGWRGSCTRVVSIAEPASLPMITLLPLLTVYEGKIFVSKKIFISCINFQFFFKVIFLICTFVRWKLNFISVQEFTKEFLGYYVIIM